jgi:hypothetical protein
MDILQLPWSQLNSRLSTPPLNCLKLLHTTSLNRLELGSSIICQLPTPETLSIQFSSATAISSHLSSRSSAIDCQFWVWVLCYDRRSVGQSVLVSSTHLGLTTNFLLLLDSCGFVDVGHSLWREDGCVVYNCCWPSPAQSFSGPSPVGLATIFNSLKFETSLFVASYDSQG